LAELLPLLPALAFLAMALAPPLNHDVAAVLNFSERWLGGERLYRDLIDVNPPLIFILSAIPAGLARWLPGLDGAEALLLCVLGLCVLSWRWVVRLRQGMAEGVVEAAVLNATVPLVLLLPAYDLGQREHLMAMAALPYLVLAARRMQGMPTPRPLALGVTLAAALGFALKPHFLAVPALVEALLLVRRGPRAALFDPLPWGMAGIWLLYLASVPLLFPPYFGSVVPLVWAYYVDTGGLSAWRVLVTDKLGPVLALLLTCLPLLAWGGAGPLARVAGAAAVGGLLSAWVQHKGWSYHIVPMAMFGGLLVAVLAARWFDTLLPEPRAARRAAPVLAAGMCFALGLYNLKGESPWRQIWYGWTGEGEIATALKREVYGERLLVLSPDVYPVYPALNYARARSSLRTMNLWLLVGVYQDCPEGGARYRETWEMSRAEFFVYRTVAEDFARAPPAAVLVSRHTAIPRCGEDFRFLDYFGRHPLFAETFQRYTRVVEIGSYLLYLRED
jgi:hypothetical protein